MNAPFHVTTLADKAMLVKLERNIWNRRVTDKALTDAAEQTVSTKRVGKFVKELAKDSPAVARVEGELYALYDYVKKNTLPWLDDGVRLLPSHRYFDFTEDVRQLRDRVAAAVANLQYVWDDVLAEDQLRLGTAYNPQDYPSAEDIATKYGSKIQWRPVPSTGDFRVGLSDDDLAELQEALTAAEDAARQDVVAQLVEPMRHAIDVLGREKTRVHDSVLGNIVEIAERLPKLLLDPNPELETVAANARQIASRHLANMDVLKSDDALKEVVSDQLKAEVDKLVGLFGGV